MTYKFSLILKKDTALNWAMSSYIPKEGEPCYDTTNKLMKIGDGEHFFSDLYDIKDDTVINELIIKTSTTIYVTLTGDDISGDGTYDAPFATPHRALELLGGKVLESDVTVGIYVGAGEYNFTESIVVNHPQASQIKIYGASITGTPISGVHYVDEDGLFPGMGSDKWICTNQAGGNDAADKTTNINLAKTRYNTVFNFTNAHGIIVEDTSLGMFDDILLLGNNLNSGSYGGIVVGHSSDVEAPRATGNVNLGQTKQSCNVAIIGFQGGIISEGASLMQIGGVQIGHCSIAIRDRASHYHCGDGETALFNCGTGFFGQFTTFTYMLPNVYGSSSDAFSFVGVTQDQVISIIMGNSNAFRLKSSNISNVSADGARILHNTVLLGSGRVYNSSIYFDNAVNGLADNGIIDSSTWENARVTFATEEVDTGITFNTPFGELIGGNYVGQNNISPKTLASNSVLDTTNWNGFLTAADSDVQKAFETLDSIVFTPSELVKIGSGYRLLGDDISNYGDLGMHAVDFSLSDAPGITNGALGINSFAIGLNNIASGSQSFSAGQDTTAGGFNSHTEGRGTVAMGVGAHAEGHGTKALYPYQHAQGTFNIGLNSETLHEIGFGVDEDNRANAFEVLKDGTLRAPAMDNTFITGKDALTLVTKGYIDAQIITVTPTTASELHKLSEDGDVTFGWRLLGSDGANYGNIGSNAIDLSQSDSASTTMGATGENSFATGYNTIASEWTAHAEGEYTTASGGASHAEGNGTIAEGGWGSHAEGYGSLAKGDSSHAEGDGTIALNLGSHASGRYNIGTSEDTIFEVGIGTGTGALRKNAFEIYTDGTLTTPEASISLINSRGVQALTTKGYVDGYVDGEIATAKAYTDTGVGIANTYTDGLVSSITATDSELQKLSEDGDATFGWRLLGRDPLNTGIIGDNAIDLSVQVNASAVRGATGVGSFAIGLNTEALGIYSFASGYLTRALGEYSLAVGRSTTVNVGASNAFVTGFGSSVGASGSNAFAQGENTHANGASSHAEGYNNTANGYASHVEGSGNTAEEYASHAAGEDTTALGRGSHSQGWGTRALGDYTFASGMWNIGSDVNTIFEVGIGIDGNSKANGFEIYRDGTLTAPESTTILIDAKGPKAVTTSEWVEAKTRPTFTAETAVSVYTPDFANSFGSDTFEYTLTQDSEIVGSINLEKGQTGEIIIKQDLVGGWNVNFDFEYIFANGAPTLNTAPGATNVFTYRVINDEVIYMDFIADYVEENIMTINGTDTLTLNGFDVLAL